MAKAPPAAQSQLMGLIGHQHQLTQEAMAAARLMCGGGLPNGVVPEIQNTTVKSTFFDK